MEKRTILKITGLGLSFTILLLGCVSTVLLFLAGQSGVDYLFPSKQLKETAQRRNPSANWQDVVMQYGWFVGLIYMSPGAAGLLSSLYHYKYLRILHLILSTFLIIVGSFIHTSLGITLLLYKVFVVYGAVRHNASLVECIYTSHSFVGYADVACRTGREALARTIHAACWMFLCWLFILSDLLFRALTFSNSQIYQGQITHEQTFQCLLGVEGWGLNIVNSAIREAFCQDAESETKARFHIEARGFLVTEGQQGVPQLEFQRCLLLLSSMTSVPRMTVTEINN